MSFFNKLFGGGEEKKKPAPAPAPKSEAEKIAEKKIKIEAALNELDVKIQAFEEKQKKFDNKIEILKAKAKELMAADKKKQAKKYVEEATKVKKQAQVSNQLLRATPFVRKFWQTRSSNQTQQSWIWRLLMLWTMLLIISKSKKNIHKSCKT